MNTNTENAVVISGMGIFTPLGRNAEEICEAILTKKSAIKPTQNFDPTNLLSDLASEFGSAETFGLDEQFCERTDRGVWFTIKALEEALAAAQLSQKDLHPTRTAVVVGTSHSGIQHVEKVLKACLSDQEQTLVAGDFYAGLTDHVAAQVCQYLHLTGLKITFSSACSSSNTAVGYASDLIKSGQADRVLVIGTDTVSDSIVAGFNSLKVLSPFPAAPFSTPSGITLGEGAGVLVLERLVDCQARGLSHRGEVLGYALSSDAYHTTSVDETGDGVCAAIEHAVASAGVALTDIEYISAHGTGTDSNDVPESQAMARLFGHKIRTSSVKSSVGHTLGASGVVELIITLLATEKGYLPPSANFNGVRPGCAELNYLPNDPVASDVNTILCNNYGFGGNNSSLVLSRAACRYSPKALPERKIFISGFGNYSAAGKTAEDFITTLDHGTPVHLNDAQYNTYTGVMPDQKGGRNSRRSSPSIEYAVLATKDAIAGAGLQDVVAQKLYETGLVGGLLHGAQKALEKYMASVFLDGLPYASSTQFPLTTLNAAAGEIAIQCGIKGFNTTLCGPAGALKFAFDAVAHGHQDRVFKFSSDELTSTLLKLCNQFGVLGKFIDQQPGPGLYLSEGAAAIALEAEDAIDARNGKKLAEVVGLKLVQDGVGNAIDSRKSGLAKAATELLTEKGLAAGDIDLVVGVGQGINEFIRNEAEAITQIFGHQKPDLTSVAMHIGYAPSAIFTQMLGYSASILNGSSYWTASVNSQGVWVPEQRRADKKIRSLLVLFTSVTHEHCAVILRSLDA